MNNSLVVIELKKPKEKIEKAKEFAIQNDICENIDIKIGRLGKQYFFINDPDEILVEIIEND